MKRKPKILISIAALALITGCTAPNYSQNLNPSEPIIEINEAVELATFNGYVVEITDDNVIKVRIPKAGQLVQRGLQINENEIINLSLSAIELPMEKMPLAAEANIILNALLPSGKEIEFNSKIPDSFNPATDTLNSFVYSEPNTSQQTIQEILVENGLAIVSSTGLTESSLIATLENLEKKAKSGELGIWAIDELLKLSNIAEVEFTKIGQYNEAQAKELVNELKARGWTAKSILEKYNIEID